MIWTSSAVTREFSSVTVAKRINQVVVFVFILLKVKRRVWSNRSAKALFERSKVFFYVRAKKVVS